MSERRHLLRKQIDNERKKRRLIVYTLFLLMMLYLTVSLFFDDMGFIKYLHLKKSEERLLQEIVSLEKENSTIQSEINNFQSNPFYLERHAREDLNLSRPDEYIFIYEQ
jgi:cell division protein FtsB